MGGWVDVMMPFAAKAWPVYWKRTKKLIKQENKAREQYNVYKQVAYQNKMEAPCTSSVLALLTKNLTK